MHVFSINARLCATFVHHALHLDSVCTHCAWLLRYIVIEKFMENRMGPFPDDAPRASISEQNPAGTDGFEFVEYAHPNPAELEALFAKMGYMEVARHKTKRISVWRQGDINYMINAEPGSHAAEFAEAHGPCASSMAWRVVNARHAYERAIAKGATPYEGNGKALDVPAIVGIGGSLLYFVETCQLEEDPEARITYVHTSPRSYGDQDIDYTPGQVIEHSISTCSSDNTFFRYSIGSAAFDPELYTFADILPDGRTILKQVDPTLVGPLFTGIELSGSTLGNHLGDVRLYGSQGIKLGGDRLNVEITSNDGNFIEGNLNGEAFDPFEVSLGTFSGTFRARIH